MSNLASKCFSDAPAFCLQICGLTPWAVRVALQAFRKHTPGERSGETFCLALRNAILNPRSESNDVHYLQDSSLKARSIDCLATYLDSSESLVSW